MSDFKEMLEGLRKQLSEIEDKIMGKFEGDEQIDTFVEESKSLGRSIKNKFKNLIDDKAENDGEEKPKSKADRIIAMAPFLDGESLHKVVVEFIDGGLEIKMSNLLPFLEDEDIELLVKAIKDNGGKPFKGLSFAELIPFASDECVKMQFVDDLKNGSLNDSLIPFLDDDALHEVVKSFISGEIDIEISKLYPFLDEDEMDELIKAYIAKGKKIGADMYPFLSEDSLHDLVVEYCENENSDIDIDSIYPFLDEKDLNMLFKAYMDKK